MEIELPTTKHAGSIEYAKLDISDDRDDPILSSEEENVLPHPHRSKWNAFAAMVISFASLAIVSGFSILAYSRASRRIRVISSNPSTLNISFDYFQNFSNSTPGKKGKAK